MISYLYLIREIPSVLRIVTLCLALFIFMANFGCSVKTRSTSGVNSNESVPVTSSSSPDFSNSKKIYAQKCSGCHSLYLPAEYTVDEWEDVLPVMFVKAKADTTEQRIINDYIMNSIKLK